MDKAERVLSQAVGDQNAVFFTPLNVLLLGLIGYGVLTLLRGPSSASRAAGPRSAPVPVFRTFTPRSLQDLDGRDGGPVLVAVRGRVFDVSAGRHFYGPGGPYAVFAGRDASRGLALQSADAADFERDPDSPLDDLAGLPQDQVDNLDEWEARFLQKYPVVGRLVAHGHQDATAESEHD